MLEMKIFKESLVQKKKDRMFDINKARATVDKQKEREAFIDFKNKVLSSKKADPTL